MMLVGRKVFVKQFFVIESFAAIVSAELKHVFLISQFLLSTKCSLIAVYQLKSF